MRIGIFDSGVGGITVLNALKTRFSAHEFLYFGDTANVPYGTKSVHQIQALVTSAAERMKERKIDALVIACNTASSIAYKNFESVLKDIPLIDVVEAGVDAILSAIASDLKAEAVSQEKPILILGTRATVKSKIYSRLLAEKNTELKVYEQECALLVPMIEEGWLDHQALKLTVHEYVAPYLMLKPGIALLACTHYPWIKKTFQEMLPGWTILDSAHAVADIAEKTLKLSQGDRPALITWYFSDPEAVASTMIDSEPHRF